MKRHGARPDALITSASRDLATRLRLAIRTAGKTQSIVSRESGVPEETISRIVTGDTPNPQVHTLKRLAPSIGVTVGWLLGEATAPITAQEQRALLAAIEVTRSRLRCVHDARLRPNAVPVGRLRGTVFSRDFADLNDSPPTAIFPELVRSGAEVVFRATDRSMVPPVFWPRS
jgi:transcriptional regulator with XRE-family HTH domain